MRPSVAGCIKCCTSSACPSVRLVSPIYKWNRKAIETSNLVETWPWQRVTEITNLGQKVKVKVTGKENVKIIFGHIFTTGGSIYAKLRPKSRLPYNLYRVGRDVKHCSINPKRPKWSSVSILHMSSDTFYRQQCFALSVCLSVRHIHREPGDVSLTQYWNVVEHLYFRGSYPLRWWMVVYF